MGWREALAAYGGRIRSLVDTAPPLTPTQRDRIAAIIAARQPHPPAETETPTDE